MMSIPLRNDLPFFVCTSTQCFNRTVTDSIDYSKRWSWRQVAIPGTWSIIIDVIVKTRVYAGEPIYTE